MTVAAVKVLPGVDQAGARDPLLVEGTRVGDFCIRGLLGEGSMGQVYLAQDVTLGRRIALKVIKRSVMQGGGVERFLEEARATASFNHPHIVTLHAVGEYDGRPYLALEYIDGESLRARLAAGPLPLREALRCARDVAEAIAEAHRHGLVHGDLKPENIVIPRDGRVRVVDFGLSKLAGDADPSVTGKPPYISPERWCGARPARANRVWAFGVLLHESSPSRRPLLAMPRCASAILEGPIRSRAPRHGVARSCASASCANPGRQPHRRRARAPPHRADRSAHHHDDDNDAVRFPGLAASLREDAADYFGRRARARRARRAAFAPAR